MSDAEKTEPDVSTEDIAEEKREQPPAETQRLSKLPLEALLYAVMYGDEWV